MIKLQGGKGEGLLVFLFVLFFSFFVPSDNIVLSEQCSMRDIATLCTSLMFIPLPLSLTLTTDVLLL